MLRKNFTFGVKQQSLSESILYNKLYFLFSVPLRTMLRYILIIYRVDLVKWEIYMLLRPRVNLTSEDTTTSDVKLVLQ